MRLLYSILAFLIHCLCVCVQGAGRIRDQQASAVLRPQFHFVADAIGISRPPVAQCHRGILPQRDSLQEIDRDAH
jgi:hypothetical protein